MSEERFSIYEELFRSKGWAQFVQDAQGEMLAAAQRVMTLNTSKDGWQATAAKYINRYRAIEKTIINAEAAIKLERNKEKAKTGENPT